MKTQRLLGLGCLLLLGGTALGFAQDRERARVHAPATLDQAGGVGHRFHGQRGLGGPRFQERMRDARRFVRSLDLSAAQRREMERVARELRPIAKDLRPEVREVLRGTRELRRAGRPEAAREYLRQELRPLREEARERALPLTRPLIDQLTPEQRALCEERARARGREFDPDRAACRLGLFLGARRPQERGGNQRDG